MLKDGVNEWVREENNERKYKKKSLKDEMMVIWKDKFEGEDDRWIMKNVKRGLLISQNSPFNSRSTSPFFNVAGLASLFLTHSLTR